MTFVTWSVFIQDKQRAKVKEKLDKCVKDKLLDFCDVLDVPVVKTAAKKVDCWCYLWAYTMQHKSSLWLLLLRLIFVLDVCAGWSCGEAVGVYGGSSCHDWCSTCRKRSGLPRLSCFGKTLLSSCLCSCLFCCASQIKLKSVGGRLAEVCRKDLEAHRQRDQQRYFLLTR